MIIKFFRKSSKIVSSSLLTAITLELLIPLNSYSSIHSKYTASSASNPVAASVSNMVDGYTGDFNYSVPLVNIPGPNGENVAVSANYHAGIGVNQKASWLGLGWDYNPGEITRQVVDAPDDYNGRLVIVDNDLYSKFGSIYNNNINSIGKCNEYNHNVASFKTGDIKTVQRDILESDRFSMIAMVVGNSLSSHQPFEPNSNTNYRFKRQTAPHTSLAYDQYNVSGGLNGKISPYFLGEVNVYHGKHNIGTNNLSVNSRKAQFYFENSTSKSIGISNGDIGDPNLVNQSTNQIHSATRVRYFTNNEINDNSNLYNNINNSGFLDYKATTNTTTNRRTEDESLIGAFQITDASGITYHYSLPVYSFHDLNYNISTNTYNFKNDKYASSWKLTAITGQDYQDANNNYTPDEGDKGYWIKYNYSKWNDDFYWSSQRYGCKTDVAIAQKFISVINSSSTGNRYSKVNSLSTGHIENYYLNYIQTSTHTAFFIKSIRLDEQSCDNIKYQNYQSNNLPKSLLKLDKIVLLNNEDKSLLINNISLSNSELDTRFDYTGSAALGDVNFTNITRYNLNKIQIDTVALKTVEFETNYCLSKKYSGNINNNFTQNQNYLFLGSTGSIVSEIVNKKGYNLNYEPNFSHIIGSQCSYVSSSDISNSGKLTLKKIKFYDFNGLKMTPSLDFNYDENNPIKNPDYSQDKYDLWGYYKKDYINSHYVTNISKDDVDAWSLKEINTSLGGIIKIEYESDIYHKEGFSGAPSFNPVHQNIYYPTPDPSNDPVSLNIPHLIFPLKSFSENPLGTYLSGYVNIEFEDADFRVFADNINPLCPQPSNYKQGEFRVYCYYDKCIHGQVPYNNGNSYYIPDPVVKLLRRGDGQLYNGSCAAPNPISYNTVFNNLYPPAKMEYDLSAVCSAMNNYSFFSQKAAIGIDYHIIFRSYMYGGGVRVKKIDVTDPFSNNTFTQNFSYGDGYCPVVPKAMELACASGPSPYDLNMNGKSLISSSVNSNIGYDYMSQTSVNQNGESLGSVVNSYYNSLINNPLDYIGKSLSRTTVYNYSNNPQYAGGCNIGFYPNTSKYTFFYNITVNLNLSNHESCLLGKIYNTAILTSDSKIISSKTYTYGKKFIQERYNGNKVYSDNFNFYTVDKVPAGQQTSYCKEVRHSVIAKDYYYYKISDVKTYNCYLIGTTSTKDGITIHEDIQDRNPYTGTPTKVVTRDPTQGTYTTFTSYAYNNVSKYPNIGLKTKNETNRNLLSLVETTKMVKNNKYVISESYATYSNSYPTRIYDLNNLEYINSNVSNPWYRLDETYNRLLDDDVLASSVAQTSDYRLTSTGTLYDSENNRIEESGLNQRKSASKWGYHNHYKLADISNANYNSFTFSSFEDQNNVAGGAVHFGGEIKNGQLRENNAIETYNSVPVLIKPHTGYYFSKVPSGISGPSFKTKNFEIGRTYIAKVWVHKTSPQNSSININLQGTAGVSNTPINITNSVLKSDANNIAVEDWVLMSVEIIVPDNFNLVGNHSLEVYLSSAIGQTGNAYFDDLSFHPKDAIISGNIYNEKNGLLIAQLDNDNFATLYNYDNSGRVISTYKEYAGGIKKVTESLYHFAKP